MSYRWCTWVAAGAVTLAAAGAAAVEPVAAGPAIRVSVSPVLVPPLAPVDVTVDARALVRQQVELQVRTGTEWTRVGTATVGDEGTARFRVTRRLAGRYVFRAVRAAAPDVAVTGETGELVVTTRGLGDPKAYRFLYAPRGVPARWNPCAVVTYRVNSARAKRPAEVADLTEALRRVTYETGIRFRRVGSTTRVPGAKGFRYDADVVVAWAAKGESEHLGGTIVGSGGFDAPVPGRGGRPRIARGFVVLDAEKLGKLTLGYGGGKTVGQVLIHELGHMLGLDHVSAADQVMRPAVSDMRAALYGAGDLAGLRRLGIRSGCL